MNWLDQSGGTGQANDVSTKLQIGNQILAQMLDLFTNLFPRSFGSFTMDAAASKVITDANCTSTSFIGLMPTNAAAATLQGSNESLYITPAAGSFTVATAAGTNAAGGETFYYKIENPI